MSDKKLFPYRLDEIENPDCLKSKNSFIDEDFPVDLFSEANVSSEQIIYLAKALVCKLQFNALSAEQVDLNKYLFNQCSKLEFINSDFFNLLASVIDFIKRYELGAISFTDPANHKFISKAINSSINAAIVLIVKRNPLITKFLNDKQKIELNNLINQTVENVKTLDKKDSTVKSKNNGVKMSDMMKYYMLSKAMKSDGGMGSMNPMMMAQLMGNGGNNNNALMQQMMMSKMAGGGNNKALQMMMLSKMMNKKKAAVSEPTMDPKTAMMMQMMGGNQMGGGGNLSLQQQMLKMYMEKQAQKKQREQTQNAWAKMFNGTNQVDNGLNRLTMNERDPRLADVYDDPNISIERPNPNEQLEALRQAMLQADAKNQALRDDIPFENVVDNEVIDTPVEDEVSYVDDMADPEFVGWLNNVDEDGDEDGDDYENDSGIPDYDEEEGMVRFLEDDDDGNLLAEYEMFSTDSDGDAIERIEVESKKTEEEKWIDHMVKDQELVIEKYFNGKVPEGVEKINVDGVMYYAFTPETLFSGDYRLTDTLKYYHANGDKPTAEAASLPLTIKGKTRVISILTSDGVRGDIILPEIKEDNEMNIDDHIPPKAIVEWRKLREQEIYDDAGNKITDGLVILENELVGTRNSASITANCFAISTEETDIDNSQGRPVEYMVNDPVGFYTEDADNVIDLFGANRDIDSVKDLIDRVKSADNLHPGIVAHIDRKGTELLNDYLHYSMGLGVSVESILEDYDDLLRHVDIESDIPYIDYLKGYEKELIDLVCNAIKGSEVENLDIIAGDMERSVETDEGTAEEVVSFDGKDYDENLVVFNNKVQVTELPWTFEETGLKLVKQFNDAEAFILLNDKEDENIEIYKAFKEIYERAFITGESRKVKIVTKDLVDLEIIKSAYDDTSFVIVNQ